MNPFPLPGVVVKMGTRDWVIPPLTLGQLRRLAPDLGRMTSLSAPATFDAETVAAIVRIVGTALRRNHPEVTDEALEEILDLGNVSDVLSAVLAGSGLRRATPGEEQAARGNGASSTASSPPPSATVPATSTS